MFVSVFLCLLGIVLTNPLFFYLYTSLRRYLIFYPFEFQLYFTAVDGWAARRFNQVSKFGAWSDVIIENIGRGIIWTRISSVIQ
jgi:phosphatidylglycerophosphate synthase